MNHNGDFGTGARMVAAAVLSAVVTCTLVIAIGQTMLTRSGPDARDAPSGGVLIRTGG